MIQGRPGKPGYPPHSPRPPFLKNLRDSSPLIPRRRCCKHKPYLKHPHWVPIPSAERSGSGSQNAQNTKRNGFSPLRSLARPLSCICTTANIQLKSTPRRKRFQGEELDYQPIPFTSSTTASDPAFRSLEIS